MDLIYLDPPFNSSANYAAPIGSAAACAAFKGTWNEDDEDLAYYGELRHAKVRCRCTTISRAGDSRAAHVRVSDLAERAEGDRQSVVAMRRYGQPLISRC